jgi:hypothetical protein
MDHDTYQLRQPLYHPHGQSPSYQGNKSPYNLVTVELPIPTEREIVMLVDDSTFDQNIPYYMKVPKNPHRAWLGGHVREGVAGVG